MKGRKQRRKEEMIGKVTTRVLLLAVYERIGQFHGARKCYS